MQIIVTHTTARLRYVASFISKFYNIPVDLVSEDQINTDDAIILNYTNKHIPSALTIPNYGLLFEKGIREQTVQQGIWETSVTLFPSEDKASDVPFDLLSAIFYLLSFYQEYTNKTRDHHDRFSAEQSIAKRYGFLKKPIIDIWLTQLKTEIEQKFETAIPTRKYRFISTIDVDMAYAILYRGWKNQVKAFVRSIRDSYFREYLNVIARREQDPFNSFDFLKEEHERLDLKPTVFFQVGENGKFDKNVPLKQKRQLQLIRETQLWATIGIHPSYPTFNRPDLIHREVKALKEVTRTKVKHSRQHYLRYNTPDTFRYLEKAGIKKDYSVGFADSIGFRGGTCTPFNFFDLPVDAEREIKLYPLAAMDSTLRHYNEYDTNEAAKAFKDIIDEVKAVNGTFISLWHNSSFHRINNMEGWDEVFIQMLKHAAT